MTAPRRFHHVANGTSTTMTIEDAGIPGTRSIWADPLHDGPVPGGVSDAELAAVRTRHLAGPHSDRVNDLFEWRRAIAAHESYDELILWYEHDLFDQLNLIQLLSFVHERLPGDKTVTLICIDSYPGRPNFKGLGELTPGELAPLFDTRQPVTVQQFALAERAWQAFRAPTPEALAQLRHEDKRRSRTSPLPSPASSRNTPGQGTDCRAASVVSSSWPAGAGSRCGRRSRGWMRASARCTRPIIRWPMRPKRFRRRPRRC